MRDWEPWTIFLRSWVSALALALTAFGIISKGFAFDFTNGWYTIWLSVATFYWFCGIGYLGCAYAMDKAAKESAAIGGRYDPSVDEVSVDEVRYRASRLIIHVTWSFSLFLTAWYTAPGQESGAALGTFAALLVSLMATITLMSDTVQFSRKK
jgi:hypothetical protein